MSTKAEMVTLVGAEVDGRLFDVHAPDKTKLPYATWIQLGGPAESYLEGENTEVQAARIQFNVWAKSTIEADDIIKNISKIIVGLPITGTPLGAPRAPYSTPTNMRGMQQDFEIWFDQ